MVSASSIPAAIEDIKAKKEALRRAFDDVQAHPSSLVPFSLQWEDLDDHVSSLQHSLEARFRELESWEMAPAAPPASGPPESTEEEVSPATVAAAACPPESCIRQVESMGKECSPAAAASGPSADPLLPPEEDACAAAEEEEPEEEEEETEEGEPEEEEEEELQEEPEPEPRPDLRSFCVKMDGKGLRVFIAEKDEDLANIEDELDRAIRAAADPAALVLAAMDGFYPAKPRGALGDTALLKNRRACILLLKRLHAISPEIKPPVRERAKQLAAEWRERIPPEGGQESALPFLQLLLSYRIVSKFELDDVLEVLVSVVEWKHAVDLCRNLGLSDKMPDFIEKLFVKKKKIEAVKFVYAFGLVDKFSPVQLLKSYLRDCKKVAVQIRRTGKFSRMSQLAATSREIMAHRAVIKAIGEYNLESEYSPAVLQRCCSELEHFKQQMLDQRKAESEANTALEAEASAALANSKALAQQEANKRPRLSTVAANTMAALHPVSPLPQTQQLVSAHPPAALPHTQQVVAAHPHAAVPLTQQAAAAHPFSSLTQTQAQVPLADRGSYSASNGPYGLSGDSYLYNHTAATYMSKPLGSGAARSPPRPTVHSDHPKGSGLYDKSGVYCSYSLSGGYRHQ